MGRHHLEAGRAGEVAGAQVPGLREGGGTACLSTGVVGGSPKLQVPNLEDLERPALNWRVLRKPATNLEVLEMPATNWRVLGKPATNLVI